MNTTTRIALRVSTGATRPDKGKVFETALGQLNVALTRLIDGNNGYIAICQNEMDIDKLLTKDAIEALKRIGLEAKPPAEIISKRSVICRRLDPWLGGHTAEEIKAEINRTQSWARVSEVIKFGNYTHVIKITFEETGMAQNAKEKGLLMFHVAVTKEQIEREVYTNIQMCFICYELESHTSRDCPKKDTKVCSECGKDGHTFRECEETTKQCLNCKGPHRTMAMSCPKKKELIKEKKEKTNKEKEIKENTTYAKVAKETYRHEQSQRPILHIDKETPTEILTCIYYAHVDNLGSPGTFSKSLNQMLENNGHKPMWFPENPASHKILSINWSQMAAIPPQEEITTKETEIQNKEHKRQGAKPKIPKKPRKTSTSEDRLQKYADGTMEYETYSDLESIESESTAGSLKDASVRNIISEIEERKQQKIKAKEEEVKTLEAKDINLTIFTITKPPNNLKDIINGIKDKKIKYEYEANITESEIEKAIFTGKIKIKSANCQTIPIEIFNKKRNGKIRSPPPEQTRASRTDRKLTK